MTVRGSGEAAAGERGGDGGRMASAVARATGIDGEDEENGGLHAECLLKCFLFASGKVDVWLWGWLLMGLV